MIRLIETSNERAINIGLPLAVNEAIKATNGHLEYLLPHWQADFQLHQPPIVGMDHIELGIMGLFFDDRIGEYDRVRFPSMPYKNSTMLHGFQIYISMQVLDSFFESMLDI